MSGRGDKPMTNPWFACANLRFGDQNPGFEVTKPGFARNPRFVQTRDQPVTNPCFTRDNPWFFSRVETLKSRWFFLSLFSEKISIIRVGQFVEIHLVSNSQYQHWMVHSPDWKKVRFMINVHLVLQSRLCLLKHQCIGYKIRLFPLVMC